MRLSAQSDRTETYALPCGPDAPACLRILNAQSFTYEMDLENACFAWSSLHHLKCTKRNEELMLVSSKAPLMSCCLSIRWLNEIAPWPWEWTFLMHAVNYTSGCSNIEVDR